MKHLIKSTAILTVSNVLTRVFAMIFFVILARAMDVSEYGLLRYLITLSLIYAIAFTGVTTALTKFISENKKKYSEYLSNTLFLIVVIFLILLIIIAFQSNSLYLSLLLFAVLVDSLYLAFSRGLLNYNKLAGYKLLENIIQLIILIVAFIIYKYVDFTFAVIFYSFSGLIALILFELWHPEMKIQLKISKEKIKKLMQYAIPVTLGAIGWSVMFGINAIFIKYYYGAEQVGYYSVGETIVQIFTFLPAAISTILMPKVASLKDKNKILKPLKLAVIGCFSTSLIILLFLMWLKSDIITFIFTEKYLPTLIVILPLALGQIFIVVHQIYASIFQGINKPAIPSITISIACILNIAGSYILTKNYGIVGAAISNAITSFIALILLMIIFNKESQKWKTH